jgi:hypothetical protein
MENRDVARGSKGRFKNEKAIGWIGAPAHGTRLLYNGLQAHTGQRPCHSVSLLGRSRVLCYNDFTAFDGYFRTGLLFPSMRLSSAGDVLAASGMGA